MTLSAIVMMIFGLGITWGGAALCIRKAAQNENKNKYK